jgi:hypothetical protein
MKPILFSTPMIQAILAGNKMQTRRIVKDQCEHSLMDGHGLCRHCDHGSGYFRPKYQIGDILWVRETWYNDAVFGGPMYFYRANGEFDEQFETHKLKMVGPFRWKPSIFMPKEACRIFLEVTDIRIERLNDISQEDLIAEGISLPNYAEQAIKDVHYPDPDVIYSLLWENINGLGSWDKNPWVWVVNFKQIGKP